MKAPPLIRYPWDKWFHKKSFKLVRGEDYFCQPHSMAVQVRGAASKRGLSVHVSINEKVITVVRRD